jgi:hypothetical protein
MILDKSLSSLYLEFIYQINYNFINK